MAEPHEIPEAFGVWLLNGPIDSGTLDLARPASHMPCKLPFPVWMALAKATPASLDGEAMQRELGDAAAAGEALANEVNDDPLRRATDA